MIKCNKCGAELKEFKEYGMIYGYYWIVYDQKTNEYNYDGDMGLDDYEVNGYYCPNCGAELDLKKRIKRFGVSEKAPQLQTVKSNK